MSKCVCCKFENCFSQFEKYKNHTTFSAMGRPVQRVYDFATKAIRGEITAADLADHCDRHGRQFADWFYDYFEPKAKVLSKGVRLRVISFGGGKAQANG